MKLLPRVPWRFLSALLVGLLGTAPAVPDDPGQTPVLDVRGLDILRAPLPPVTPGVLDGLGASAPCPAPQAPLDRVLYDSLLGHGAALSCGNAFTGLLAFPEDDAGISDQPTSPLGGFEAVVRAIGSARREVLLANMVWDDGAGSPGEAVAGAIAGLRRDLTLHPERYPQGVTVRLLLGNSVRFGDLLDPTASAYSAARQLLAAGVPLGHDPVPGWRLEIANYAYAYPHSHVKLLVLDGQEVLSGGFNISWFHVPTSTPGGLGLSDLALGVRGPVARHAVAAFRDSWLHARPLECVARPDLDALRRDCPLGDTTAPYGLVWSAPPRPSGNSRVYGLYRRSGEEAADQAVIRLLGAATGSIDLLQSQVSGTPACTLSLLAPGGCPFPNRHLPVWQAIAGAVRERGVHVRMVLDYDPLLRLETLAFLAGLWDVLRPLGLEDHLQARWSGTAGGQHTKAALIDDAMLVVGSQNLQFASFGAQGLSEYSLATSDPQALALGRRQFDFEWARAQPLSLPSWLRPPPGR
ncbi:phospholipase D-like domain-containing protein [Deinococcus koreensis]|uniref:phospholipase D n=1 Tax=Deinococcus koreensis TaxID=2054903 RepID=A0A2K3V160_9DEIO|nr:phospholipase D-like domain-containing protein [Deinococcus koreensis]PNY82517.1 phospholipase [Deinococcus koreensis]